MDEKDELRKRFLQQVEGTAKRNYSRGRLGAEDDGDLAISMAADTKKGVVIIDFGKPTSWIGLDVQSAETMLKHLTDSVTTLKKNGW